MNIWVEQYLGGRRGGAVLAGLLAALFLAGGQARASGFFLQEQSPAASGRAFAGDAAAAEDASTIFYNPAGMTELHGKFAGEVGAYLIAPQAKIENRGSTVSVGGGTPAAVKGAAADQGFDPQPLGDIYLAAPVAARAWIGLGLTAPFGLKDQYASDYFGRYDSTKADLRTSDVAPSAAYAVTKWLSVGAGLDIQRADATLRSALPNPYGAGGPSAATDGFFDATGGDWALGFNAGFLLKPSRDLRLGFSYRSGLDHTPKGSSVKDIGGPPISSPTASPHF